MTSPDKIRAVDDGVPAEDWRRVSWITPILNSWQAIVAVVAIIAFQNIDTLRALSEIDAVAANPIRIVLWGLAVLAVLLLIILGFSYLSWRAMSYAVTDRAVWLRKGIILRSQRHVRFERIQAVDLVHPLLGRIFGLGKLTVEAAGGAGSNLNIGFLSTDKLTGLRAEILAGAAGVRRSAASRPGGGDEVPRETGTTEEGEAPGAVAASDRFEDTFEIQEAPETELYSVGAGRLVGSAMLSGAFIASLLVLLALVAGSIVAAVLGGPEVFWGVFGGVIPGGIALAAFLWSRFAGEFNFRAAVSPDGIRIRRGLAESRAETIPPRRIHGVKIVQPLLWRKRGWYRVSITQAAKAAGEQGSMRFSSVLLPVGDKQQALLALWLVLPDLGVEDPVKLFDEALHGSGEAPGFYGVPRRARIFDPLVYKRAGIRLTETAAVVRSGRISRWGKFISYERIQSQVVTQGPWDRSLRLANVALAMVPGFFQIAMSHLSVEDTQKVVADLTQMSQSRRLSEPPEKWLARIEAELGPEGTLSSEEIERLGEDAAAMGESEEENDRWKPSE